MKKLFFLTVITVTILLVACKTEVKKNPLGFDQITLSNEYLGWWGRTVCDVNKDGLMDLVVLKQSRTYGLVSPGWLGWYEASEGGKTWTKHLIEENDLYGSGDMDAGDIDGDGDIDILAFEADETSKDTIAKMFWHENLGDSKIWKKHFIDYNPEFVKDVELADFNGDGKLEIVTITFGWHNTLEIHRMESPDKWVKTVSMKITNLHEGMDVGDIDGDGDLDVATCGYWLENPGDNSASWNLFVINDKWHNQGDSIFEWRKNGTKTFCIDINNDKKSEIFISHSEANVDGYPVAWYEAANPKESFTEHVIAPDFRHCHTLQVFDMDLDGDLDVVTGEIPEHPTQKRARIFLNKGDNLTWDEFALGDSGIYNGIVADLEGDGDFDIFTAPGFSNQFPEFKVFVNQVIQAKK